MITMEYHPTTAHIIVRGKTVGFAVTDLEMRDGFDITDRLLELLLSEDIIREDEGKCKVAG